MNAPLMLRRLWAVAAFALALVLVAQPAAAQQVFLGRVIDYDTQEPIPGVEVSLLGERGKQDGPSVRTDTAGFFRVRASIPTRYKFRLARIGYLPLTSPVFPIGKDEFLEVQLSMSATATVLAPLMVLGKTKSKGDDPLDPLFGLDMRQALGLGRYMAHDQIETRNPLRFTHLLREIQGFSIIPGGDGGSDTVATTRSQMFRTGAEGRCIPALFIDGFPQHGDDMFDLVDVYLPDRIEELEFYASGLIVPGQFATRQANDCGAIVVWTRRTPYTPR